MNPDIGRLFIVIEIMELSIYSYVFLAMNCIQYTKPELNLVLALVNLPASDSCLVVTT